MLILDNQINCLRNKSWLEVSKGINSKQDNIFPMLWLAERTRKIL